MKRILCNIQPWNRAIDIALFEEQGDRSMIGAPVVMKQRKSDTFVSEPTVQLKPDEAQELMDELWRCGLRPSEGTGSAGSLAATERHLEDMRKIAMKQLGIERS